MKSFPLVAVIAIFITLLVAVTVVSYVFRSDNSDLYVEESAQEELHIPSEGTERYDSNRHKTPGDIIRDSLSGR